MLQIGDKMPRFCVTDQDGNTVTDKDLIGKPTVLYVYPKDSTPGCTAEACNIRDNYHSFLARGYQVYGVSKDSAASHRRFIDKYDLPFPLLSDPTTELLQSLGAWGELGRIEEAYQTIVPMYKVHHGHYTTICMFWCGADMAKLQIERKETKKAERILASLRRLYPSLEDKDNSARQTLLNIAMQVAGTDSFSFAEFVGWWGLDNLTDEDWKAGESNGHPLPSRGQKIATLLFHEARKSEEQEVKQQVLAFIEVALLHNQRNRNLQRAKAMLLAETGDKQQAIKIYRQLARYGREAYIFSELAELTDDVAEKTALTIKSVQLQRSEAFRQKDRLRLASLLADVRPHYARYELDKVLAVREQAGQHNNRQINSLLRQLQTITPATPQEQQQFYEKAMAYLYK